MTYAINDTVVTPEGAAVVIGVGTVTVSGAQVPQVTVLTAQGARVVYTGNDVYNVDPVG